MEAELVDDPDDPRLDDYRSLKDAELRRRREAAGPNGPGSFVIEGVTAIRRLLTSPYAVRSVLVTPAKHRVLAEDLAAAGVAVLVARPAILEAVAGFDLHRGAIASADRRSAPSVATVLGGATTVAILEGLTDHENLGAIGRSAVALGVGGLLLDPTCADPLYRRSVRVSMGGLLLLAFTRLAPWPAALDQVSAAGFTLLALTPSEDAVALDEVRLAQGRRVALLLGSEGPGLSAGALAAADERVRIPLAGGADSLNVGHAAAIAFHRFGCR